MATTTDTRSKAEVTCRANMARNLDFIHHHAAALNPALNVSATEYGILVMGKVGTLFAVVESWNAVPNTRLDIIAPKFRHWDAVIGEVQVQLVEVAPVLHIALSIDMYGDSHPAACLCDISADHDSRS